MDRRHQTGYDFLRIIAISAVVAIHAHSSFLRTVGPREAGSLLILELTGVYVVAVPIFFMISGALLLDDTKAIPLKELFFVRIKKQAVPFLLWSGIYTAARIVYGTADFAPETFIALLYEPAYAQFWFMYTLLGIYLILPIIQILVWSMTKGQFQYLLVIWLAFCSLIPMASAYIPWFSISSHVDLVLCEGYIGFFLLGYYLKKYGTGISTRTGLLLYLGGAVATGLLIWLEWLHTNSERAIAAGMAYGGYLFPGAVAASAGLFIVFQNNTKINTCGDRRWVKALSQKTFGVFYVHMLLLVFCEKAVFTDTRSVFWTLTKAGTVIVGSFTVSILFSHIPIVGTLLFDASHGRKRRGRNDP